MKPEEVERLTHEIIDRARQLAVATGHEELWGAQLLLIGMTGLQSAGASEEDVHEVIRNEWLRVAESLRKARVDLTGSSSAQ